MDKLEILKALLKERVLVLDGAMGTMIQQAKLTEADYRGQRFSHWKLPLKGNNDLLNLTRPELIQDIHQQYLEAGADIIETNTFNSTAISMADYGMEELVHELNFEGARIAKEVAQEFSLKNPEKPRFVAGSIGPTNKMASMSPEVNNPAFRAVSFDLLKSNYYQQSQALIEGGCDILLVETIFDTLNAKAALFAINELMQELNYKIPVMVSGTISDASGRLLSGQTLEAFVNSLSHIELLSIGLNCALGAEEMRPHLHTLSQKTGFAVSAHPNAGLPNQFGAYDQSPEIMSKQVAHFLDHQYTNIIGGCCGTTPEHIKAFAHLAQKAKARPISPIPTLTQVSGLEVVPIEQSRNFVNIGERTNVSGSKMFARLIREKKYEEALEVARHQIEGGAQIIDVCMDDGMLDAAAEMKNFLNLIASEPDIAKLPVMIDSSKWEVIVAGLQCHQGKAIVNSISLKEGEAAFLEKAETLKNYGAAAVIMAFDEKGQATSFQEKIEVCQRSYKLLTKKINFPPQDIIFDPNILSIGTGMDEHRNYAVDFINATRWIKENLPHAKVSGGISNLSFAFRGHDVLREAIHSVFLFYAIKAGMDMGIVNPAMLQIYDEIPADLLLLVEDLVLNRNEEATDRLLAYAQQNKSQQSHENIQVAQWRELGPVERLKHALIQGITSHIEEDIEAVRPLFASAIGLIEGPLMDGMNEIGERFGTGKMFLPQVVKSARVMKKAVSILMPYIETENKGEKSSAGKVLLATVKGDVHDIGKNIVSVVLACNNFEIIDLGVMVPLEKILDTALKEKVDLIGLSGLITPSLDEMINIAQEMKERKLNIPLLIGGATTSEIHTAVKIVPQTPYPVVHVRDASMGVNVSAKLLSDSKEVFMQNIREKYQQLVEKHQQRTQQKNYLRLEEANRNAFAWKAESAQIVTPNQLGIQYFHDFPLEEIIPLIDWSFFFQGWRLTGKFPQILDDPEKGTEARKLYADAQLMLQRIVSEKMLTAKAAIGIFKAQSTQNQVEVQYQNLNIPFHFLRNQEMGKELNLCLSDFIAPKTSGYDDYLGLFVVSTGFGIEAHLKHFENDQDDYSAIMLKLLADRLAEAFAALMHQKVRREIWGFSANENTSLEQLHSEKHRGIRPAPGYPACPDHDEKRKLFKLLHATEQIGVQLTESYAMYPASSVSGYYFAHPKAQYFNVGKIKADQIEAYCSLKGQSAELLKKVLSSQYLAD